jgi:hypothetical protein
MSDNEFKANEWAGLAVTERVARCQVLNNEALTLADNPDPNQAAAYRSLARAWMKLADAIGDDALLASKTEKPITAELDSIPLPECTSRGDATHALGIPSSEPDGRDAVEAQPANADNAIEAQPAIHLSSEPNGTVVTQTQPENIFPSEPSSNSPTTPHETLQKSFEASGRQAKAIIRLTYAILVLTVVMLFSVAVQIWLGHQLHN